MVFETGDLIEIYIIKDLRDLTKRFYLRFAHHYKILTLNYV